MKTIQHHLYSLCSGIVTLLLFLVATPGIASAHVLKEDNGISAVLHIPPEDNPEANKPTELDLFFGNEQKTFNLQDCNCAVTVQSNGKVIQSVIPKPAESGNTVDAVGTVNFPAIGIYNVIVEGSSKDGTFNPFRLDYLERVAVSANGSGQPPQNNSNQIIISAFSFLILTILAYTFVGRGSRYKVPKTKSKKASKK